jgi:hypothetical protein
VVRQPSQRGDRDHGGRDRQVGAQLALPAGTSPRRPDDRDQYVVDARRVALQGQAGQANIVLGPVHDVLPNVVWEAARTRNAASARVA